MSAVMSRQELYELDELMDGKLRRYQMRDTVSAMRVAAGPSDADVWLECPGVGSIPLPDGAWLTYSQRTGWVVFSDADFCRTHMRIGTDSYVQLVYARHEGDEAAGGPSVHAFMHVDGSEPSSSERAFSMSPEGFLRHYGRYPLQPLPSSAT